MMNKNQKWGLTNIIVSGAIAVLSLVQLFTDAKSQAFQEEMADKRLEEKYGLVPVNKEGN